jgi:hypothetical protein
MEELQSTEALDREILEDARRKAFRILKAADDTVKTGALAWEDKISRAAEDLRRRFEERCKKTSEEIMARFPLDKSRAESEKIESLLRTAMDTWYAAQSREKILGLLERELRRRLEDCPEFGNDGDTPAGAGGPAAASPGRSVKAMFYKLSREEGESLLTAILPRDSWETVDYNLSVEGAASASSTGPGAAIRASGVLSGKYPELVLDSPGVRITASINMLAASLMADYRSELAAALIGDNHRIFTGGPR